MLVLRSQRPIGVTRASLLPLKDEPSGFRTSFESTYIDRNLQMRNGSPCLPNRSCQKKTGPGDPNFTRAATINRRGLSRIKPHSATDASSVLFMNCAMNCSRLMSATCGFGRRPKSARIPGVARRCSPTWSEHVRHRVQPRHGFLRSLPWTTGDLL